MTKKLSTIALHSTCSAIPAAKVRSSRWGHGEELSVLIPRGTRKGGVPSGEDTGEHPAVPRERQVQLAGSCIDMDVGVTCLQWV